MTTLEEKILGEKLHNYCSSSEESDNENSDLEESNGLKIPAAEALPPDINKWEGTSTNTGPKGVIKDFKDYKQLESEKRRQEEKHKIELARKFTMTVQSSLEEERAIAALDDPEMAELLNDEFLLNYQKKRMQELLAQTNHNIKFGELIILKNGEEFLDAIDKEHNSVTIIVHIYENNIPACHIMNACLKQLCTIYENVKFCAIIGSSAGISKQFKSDGLPALLVYKAGNLVGNFVRLSDELGHDFTLEDVQNFLVEHGLLEDKSCLPTLIRDVEKDSDSE